MGKKRSIHQQFQYAISQAVSFGEYKHAATPKQRKDKIYSVGRTEDLRGTAKSLSKYLREQFPEVKLVRDIRAEHIVSWIEAHRGKWSDASLNEYISRLHKLDILCKNAFGGKGWGRITVKPREKAHKLRNAAMNWDDYQMLRHSLSKSRSAAKYAIEISGRSGLRIEECACLRVRDIDTDRWTLFVSREGAKNGRARTLSIHPEDRDYYANLKAQKGDGYICGGVQSQSLDRAIRRHMKELGISERYPCTTNHAIRKMFARRRMAELRGPYPLEDQKKEMEFFGKVSAELGHGEKRPKLYAAYIGG